jgi:hypothetical protein
MEEPHNVTNKFLVFKKEIDHICAHGHLSTTYDLLLLSKKQKIRE